jgi:hypothetical protein
VDINGKWYSRPTFLDKESYAIANKRLALVCLPKPKSIAKKRKLVYSAFSSSSLENLKAINDSEIE